MMNAVNVVVTTPVVLTVLVFQMVLLTKMTVVYVLVDYLDM